MYLQKSTPFSKSMEMMQRYKCVKAVLNLFPPELSENKDIKLGYTQKFNSYDYST